MNLADNLRMRIRALAAARGLQGVGSLGEQVGCSLSQLNRIMGGVGDLRVELVDEIAVVLGLENGLALMQLPERDLMNGAPGMLEEAWTRFCDGLDIILADVDPELASAARRLELMGLASAYDAEGNVLPVRGADARESVFAIGAVARPTRRG